MSEIYSTPGGFEIPESLREKLEEAKDRREAKSELIRIAAVLAQCRYLPSDLVDDYPQKTYSASRVAKMMEKAHAVSKDLAVEIRRIADSLLPAKEKKEAE